MFLGVVFEREGEYRVGWVESEAFQGRIVGKGKDDQNKLCEKTMTKC